MDNSCENCKYDYCSATDEPCRECAHNGGVIEKFVANDPTIAEKREKIKTYCETKVCCDGCPLEDSESYCYGPSISDEQIEEYYERLFSNSSEEPSSISSEDIQRINSKREIVIKYCGNSKCDESCVLNDKKWRHFVEDFNGVKCLAINRADEAELDKAIELIEGEVNEDKTTDPIKPEYYNDTKITPIDVIDDWRLNFYLGSAIKYIKRAGKKEGNSRLQDLKKVRAYIDHEIKVEEARE